MLIFHFIEQNLYFSLTHLPPFVFTPSVSLSCIHTPKRSLFFNDVTINIDILNIEDLQKCQRWHNQ